MIFLLFIVFTASFPFAQAAVSADEADQCSEVRLDTGSGSMARLPIYNQGPDGLCYAYTGSQLIDAWRFSHGDENTDLLTSPVYGAAAYAANGKDQELLDLIDEEMETARKTGRHGLIPNLQSRAESIRRREKKVDFGYVDLYLNSLRNRGSACSVKDIFGPRGQAQYQEKIQSLIRLKTEAQRLAPDQLDGRDFKSLTSCVVSRVFSTDIAALTSDIGKAFQVSLNENEYLLQVFDAVCQRRISMAKIPKPTNLVLADTQTMSPSRDQIKRGKKAILKQLSQPNPQPIGISYCQDVLFKRWSCEGKHGSVIVGRKMINGSCHAIIRNTWGKTCEPRGQKYAYSCDGNGQIYIPLDDLLSRTSRLTWLSE